MRVCKDTGRTVVIAAVLAVGGWQLAALKTAAGGTSGSNGFHDVTEFLDKLAGYLMWIAIPAGALGIIAGGAQLIAGSQDGASTIAKCALGVGLILLSRGILA